MKNEIREKIIRLLSYRMRSKRELELILLNKGHNKRDIDENINYLELKGYLDDNLFTKMYAKHLVEYKLLGRISVLNKFRTHRIEVSIINEVLDDLYIKNKPADLIEKNVNKKFNCNSNDFKCRAKIASHLQRKGFSYDDINSYFHSIEP